MFRSLPLDSIVCVDETGFSNIGNAFYGYFEKGKQPTYVCTKKKLKLSCAMAISSSEMLHHSLQPEAYNTNSYLEFIRELLTITPDTVTHILMDNISFHKSLKVKALIENANKQILFIPPASPWFDPIEEVFSVLKNAFRKYLLESNNFEESVDNAINYLKSQEHVCLGMYQHTLQYCM